MATTTMERPSAPIAAIDLSIDGMTCASCVGRVERALASVPGVTAATVDLASEKAHVQGSGAAASALLAAVSRSGYRASLLQSDVTGEADAALDRHRLEQSRQEGQRALLAIVLALPLVLPMLSMPFGLNLTLPAWVQFLLATPVQFWLGARFYRAGFAAVRSGSANMDVLVALGTGAAFGLSLWNWLVQGHGGHGLYFEAAALVVALVLLGKWLEGRAKRMTGAALRALGSLRPSTARVIVDGDEMELPIQSVSVGDRVLVRPGERVPVDGTIIEGAGRLDESMVTGESMPVLRLAGQQVIGGTINQEAVLLIETTATGAETVLARIIRLVENAQATKADVQRLVDQVSAWFVPIVLAIAFATMVGWWLVSGDVQTAIINAVTVLVIACPCALGLATPVAIVAGTGAAARAGILIRDPAALETAQAIDIVAFDKTGTLTIGKPELTALIVADGQDEADMLATIGALQRDSEHPLAEAIRQAADARKLPRKSARSVQAMAGRGLEGVVGGVKYAVLSERGVREASIVDPRLDQAAHEEASKGRTVSWLVSIDLGKALAVMSFGDRVRPHAKEAVAALQDRGLRVVMLSGDNPSAASAIASDLNISEFHAELLPEDKVTAIERLRSEGARVAMVGDGINDAPALAAADLGIAVGSGTDVAMASAGVTLVRSDPRLVAAALDIATRTCATIRQGLVFAFAYNVLLIPLAVMGMLTPVFAGAAMALSSVSVVTNAWRLGRWRANSSLRGQGEPDPSDG